jgi:hypothetical protein
MKTYYLGLRGQPIAAPCWSVTFQARSNEEAIARAVRWLETDPRACSLWAYEPGTAPASGELVAILSPRTVVDVQADPVALRRFK